MNLKRKGVLTGSRPIGSRAARLVAVLCLAGSFGCEPAKPALGLPRKAAGSAPQAILSNWGGFRVTVEPGAGTIPLNQPFDLRLSIDPTGSPAQAAVGSGIDVQVDAEMPAHHHGMTRSPEVLRVGERSYLARGLLFHMPGHWQVHVDITQDGRTDRAEVGWDLE